MGTILERNHDAKASSVSSLAARPVITSTTSVSGELARNGVQTHNALAMTLSMAVQGAIPPRSA